MCIFREQISLKNHFEGVAPPAAPEFWEGEEKNPGKSHLFTYMDLSRHPKLPFV